MSRLWRISVLGALFLIVGSCSSVRFIVDWDTHHDFSGYRTFAWFELAPSPHRGQPPTQANAIVAGRIRRSVTDEIERRGLAKADVGDADAMVTYALVLQAGAAAGRRPKRSPKALWLSMSSTARGASWSGGGSRRGHSKGPTPQTKRWRRSSPV
jgi:hypothetical protein